MFSILSATRTFDVAVVSLLSLVTVLFLWRTARALVRHVISAICTLFTFACLWGISFAASAVVYERLLTLDVARSFRDNAFNQTKIFIESAFARWATQLFSSLKEEL